MKWRKLNNILHRDMGYFFFGMCVIYGLSGIALNHINDWDPNYVIRNEEISVPAEDLHKKMTREEVEQILEVLNADNDYKKHYYPAKETLKVFLDGGSLTINILSGKGQIETISRRNVFFEVNYLHYNHAKFLWTWFSDLFAAGLILLAVTGLFVLKGKNGLKKRGIWFVLAGILIPLIFLIVYL